MAAGLQTFDEGGALALDATFGVPKFIQLIPLTGDTEGGSAYIPLWETQQPWFVAITATIQSPLFTPPKVWVEGAYIKWDKRQRGGQAIIVGHR